MTPVGIHRILGCVAFPSRDDQTLRPAQSDEGMSAATTGGRPDAGDARHDESAQVNLHLILLPGDHFFLVGDARPELLRTIAAELGERLV